MTIGANAFNDAEILERLKAGDPEGCTLCVRAHSDELYRLAYRMLRDPAAAEDVVQDTFVNAFKGLDKFDGRAALGTWLFRIAYNNALMRLRSRRPTAPLEAETDGEGLGFTPVVVRWSEQPEEIVEQHETAEVLERAIDSLPLPLKTVFQLRDIEERSTEETAEILGASRAAVKVRLHRARLVLREKLSGYLNQDVPPEAATMTCEQLIPYLSEYVDNSIDEPLATAARQHIATCPHCHVLVDTTRQTITLMQAGKARVIPAADKTRLVAEIQSAFDERRRAGERT
jgi:RNA polymerase sigma-70 factor (ECF subfamily)